MEIPALLKAASDAGATSAGYVLLRLPHQIKAIFLEWVQREFPLRASRVENSLREMRDGELYQADFATRMKGTGERAKNIGDTFDLFARKYGLSGDRRQLSSAAFLARRKSTGQLNLFDQ